MEVCVTDLADCSLSPSVVDELGLSVSLQWLPVGEGVERGGGGERRKGRGRGGGTEEEGRVIGEDGKRV